MFLSNKGKCALSFATAAGRILLSPLASIEVPDDEIAGLLANTQLGVWRGLGWVRVGSSPEFEIQGTSPVKREP